MSHLKSKIYKSIRSINSTEYIWRKLRDSKTHLNWRKNVVVSHPKSSDRDIILIHNIKQTYNALNRILNSWLSLKAKTYIFAAKKDWSVEISNIFNLLI